MDVGSLFAGIGGFDLASLRASASVRASANISHPNANIAFSSEIDPAALAVLAHHFPAHVQLGDIRGIDPTTAPAVDCLVGGFPCQDLSVAGKRAGLGGARSGLFWEIMRLVDGLRPRWLVLENVPGLLSSNSGRDMGTVVATLAERGYGWAYRVLDAQYFGVAQRRRRVFIVGHLGDPAPALRVLFERGGVPGHPPPRRQTGPRTPAPPPGSPHPPSGFEWHDGGGFAVDTATPVMAERPRRGVVAVEAFEPRYYTRERTGGAPDTLVTLNATQRSGDSASVVAVPLAGGFPIYDGGSYADETASTLLSSRQGRPAVVVPALALRERGRPEGRTLESQGELAYALTNSGDGGRRDALVIAQPINLTPGEGQHTRIFDADGVYPSLGATQPGEIIAQALLTLNPGDHQAKRVYDPAGVSPTLSGMDGRGQTAPTIAQPIPIMAATMLDRAQNGLGIGEAGAPMYTLDTYGNHGVAQVQWASGGGSLENDTAQALRANAEVNYQFVRAGYHLRRLTPRECERLQGFPDDWTRWDAEGKPLSNTARYRLLGNAVAVPVVEWLMRRLLAVHEGRDPDA